MTRKHKRKSKKGCSCKKCTSVSQRVTIGGGGGFGAAPIVHAYATYAVPPPIQPQFPVELGRGYDVRENPVPPKRDDLQYGPEPSQVLKTLRHNPVEQMDVDVTPLQRWQHDQKPVQPLEQKFDPAKYDGLGRALNGPSSPEVQDVTPPPPIVRFGQSVPSVRWDKPQGFGAGIAPPKVDPHSVFPKDVRMEPAPRFDLKFVPKATRQEFQSEAAFRRNLPGTLRNPVNEKISESSKELRRMIAASRSESGNYKRKTDPPERFFKAKTGDAFVSQPVARPGTYQVVV